MLDGVSMPVICAANPCSCQWFVHLKSLMNHPILKEDEKFLWCWLPPTLRATADKRIIIMTCPAKLEERRRMPSKIPMNIERLNGVVLPLTKRRAPKTFNLLPKKKPQPNRGFVFVKSVLKAVRNYVLDYPNFRRKLWNASFGYW